MTTPTKLAAIIKPGDVIGYEGEWRVAKAVRPVLLPMGGLAVVVAWEQGGSARFPAGDELLLGEAKAAPVDRPDFDG
ncbi:hypothetical protein [Streptomyces sp. NBC_01750]|uniref:hypothetical protein n=1 Tax=Streptomyces sp. NBC_01750 TaxID=2975928 RepID=UPI002DD81427|nr:hypothetical protein [Streptomyces sp. NBC_01750]WSD33344.1 hypothetical protein OG966_16385 [Streptomyces sp. NBC_01750]